MNNCSDCPYGPYSDMSDTCDSCVCDPDTGFGGFTDNRVGVHFNNEEEQSSYYRMHGATRPDEEDDEDVWCVTQDVDDRAELQSVMEFETKHSQSTADFIHFTGVAMDMQKELLKKMGVQVQSKPLNFPYQGLRDDDPVYYKQALTDLINKAQENGITVQIGKGPKVGVGIVAFSNDIGEVAGVQIINK